MPADEYENDDTGVGDALPADIEPVAQTIVASPVDVELALADLDEALDAVMQTLEEAGAPCLHGTSLPEEIYGPSADAMLVALQPVFDDFPICPRTRLIIRQGIDGETRTLRVPRRNAA